MVTWYLTVEMVVLALPLTLMHFNLACVTRVCNDVTGTTSDWWLSFLYKCHGDQKGKRRRFTFKFNNSAEFHYMTDFVLSGNRQIVLNNVQQAFTIVFLKRTPVKKKQCSSLWSCFNLQFMDLDNSFCFRTWDSTHGFNVPCHYFSSLWSHIYKFSFM